PLSGSATAITVYQVEWPPLEIQHLAPLSTHSSPSRRARVRIDAASLPASRSDSAYDATASPAAIDGRTCFLSSSEPRNSRPIVPSLLQIGISDDDARGDRVAALAAVLLGNVDRRKAGRGQRRQGFIGVAGLFVDVGRVRGDLLLAQVTQHRTQFVVLVGELESVKRRVSEGHGDSLLLASNFTVSLRRPAAALGPSRGTWCDTASAPSGSCAGSPSAPAAAPARPRYRRIRTGVWPI